jgi:hypothetical protein
MLEKFYRDKEMRETVRAYLLQYLERRAVELVFQGKDTSGITQAKSTLDEAFENLETEFAPKAKPKEDHEAR